MHFYMDKLQVLAFFAAFFFYLYVPTKQAMHMYQQNRYNMERYGTWLKGSIKRKHVQILRTFLCLSLCYGLLLVSYDNLPNILLIMLVFIISYISSKIEEEKEYRKPLVYTSRIKRLLAAFYLFYTLLCAGLITLPINLLILITPLLFFAPWVFLIIVGSLMLPVEEEIRTYYMEDAKRILRRRKDLHIIGITGSYGKTSVKTILQSLLSDTYYSLMTPHSYNNQMGITLTIRSQLQNLHEIFVCEMGADHVHEIEHLMEFVQPSVGIVTAVGPQHLQTFHTMENILHEKMQMIEKLPQDGIGFLNADNAYIRSYTLQNTCRILWFGRDEKADYQIRSMQYTTEGTNFIITHKGESFDFHTKLLGEHNIMNITCAIAVAHSFQVSWEVLKKAVQNLEFVEHRLQIREGSTYTILDNAYNSNPEGASYALDVLEQMRGKRIIVTPGFIDLGNQQDIENQQFGEHMAKSCDEIILVGKLQTKAILDGLKKQEYPRSQIHLTDSIQEAFALLQTIAHRGDVVLLENDLPDAFNH